MLILIMLVVFINTSGCSAYIRKQQGQLIVSNQNISATSLTIDEAVAIALLNKPNLAAYKHAIEVSKAKGMQIWSEYLPQVNLTANTSKILGQNNLQTTISLGAQQLVYAFAGPIEKYKLAKKQTNIVELTRDREKKAIKNAVEIAFLECWKVQKQNATIIALHAASTATYKKQSHANKLQLLDKSDWLKNDADHAQNLAIIENYYQNIELTKKKLEFFMGQPIDLTLKRIKKPTSILLEKLQHVVTIDLEWLEPKKIMLLPIKTYYKYAMKNREELKIASKNIGIAKDQVYIAQRSNLPRIDIVGATGHQSQIGLSPCGIIEGPLVQNVPHNFYNIGVQVSWPIFNGLLNNNIEKEAHATMLKEILNKDHSLQEIKFAIDTAYHTLKQALVSIKAKKIDLVYTRNNIKLKKLQFKTGDISKIELDLALADWERAEYTWIDLIVDAAIKEKNLAFACGYPKELF